MKCKDEGLRRKDERLRAARATQTFGVFFMMKSIALSLAFVFAAHGVSVGRQKKATDDTWVKVSICEITFLLPPDMRKLDTESIDSCIAAFSNGNMSLALDFGFYSSEANKMKTHLDYKKQSITIGGKPGTLEMFIDESAWGRGSGKKYVAHAHVITKPGSLTDMQTSLMLTVRGKSAEAQLLARRIFESVSFQ